MPFRSAVKTAVFVGVAITVIPFTLGVLQPHWAAFQKDVRDCLDTKPGNRTPEQKRTCQSRGSFGLIIPGVM